MRRIFKSCLAISACGVIWAGDIKHTDAVLGFEVTYPSGWKKTHPKKTNQSLVEFTSPDGHNRVIVNPMPNGQNISAIDYLKGMQQQSGIPIKAIKGIGEMTGVVVQNANADTAARALYTFDVVNMTTLFTAQKIAYMVISEGPYKEQKGFSAKNNDEAARIVNSFRIIRLP